MWKPWQGAPRAWLSAVACAALLSACGGGGGSPEDPEARARAAGVCTYNEQVRQFRDYMRDWYYFIDQAPQVDAGRYANDFKSFFYASLYTVSDRGLASDHWSFLTTVDEMSALYEEGRDLGYGLRLTWPEGRTDALLVTHVAEGSPAAQSFLRRGESVNTVNGARVADMSADALNRAFWARQPGESVSLGISSSQGSRTVTLYASSYTLRPLARAARLSTPNGSQAGYIRLDDFTPVVYDELKGVVESMDGRTGVRTPSLILDLRYDGGGSLPLAAWLVNQLAGRTSEGKLMTRLTYNRHHPEQNVSFESTPLQGWRTVYVLTGPDTCSASEFVVNALRPYANVVQIGGQTCGKPFGFEPVEPGAPCNDGTLLNVVNFESFNARGEGRYYAGLAPTCEVRDDLSREPGDAQEGMTAAALSHIDMGACPTPAAQREQPASMEPGSRSKARVFGDTYGPLRSNLVRR